MSGWQRLECHLNERRWTMTQAVACSGSEPVHSSKMDPPAPTCTNRRHHKTSGGANSPTPANQKRHLLLKQGNGATATEEAKQEAERHRKLSRMLECLSDKIRLVKLRQLDPSSKLGFSLRGGKEPTGSSVGVFVSHVERLSEAHRKGLKVGDRLIEVNGLSVNEATYDQVIGLIKRTPRAQDIELRVQNLAKIPVQERPGEPIRWLSVLELLLLEEEEEEEEEDADFRQSDKCYAVDAAGAGSGDAEHLELEVAGGGEQLEPDEGMGSYEESRLSAGEASGSEASDSSERGGGGGGTRRHELEQSSDSAVSSATLSSSSSSSSSSSACSVSVSSASSSLSGKNPREELASCREQLVQLCVPAAPDEDHRPSASFGCGVVKGPDEWPGIFVQNVSPGSLAERVGLEPGDQLVSAQGQPLEELPFDEAIKLIKRLQLHQSRLLLQVRKGAALRHLAAHGATCRPAAAPAAPEAPCRKAQELSGCRITSSSDEDDDDHCEEDDRCDQHPRRGVAPQAAQQRLKAASPQGLQKRPAPRRPGQPPPAVGVGRPEVERARRQRPATPPQRRKTPASSPEQLECHEQVELEVEAEEIRIVSSQHSYKLLQQSGAASRAPVPGAANQQLQQHQHQQVVAARQQHKVPKPQCVSRPAPNARLRSFDEMRRQMEERAQVAGVGGRLSRYVSMDNISETLHHHQQRVSRSRDPCQTSRIAPGGATCCGYAAASAHRLLGGPEPVYQTRARPSSVLGRHAGCVGCTWRPAGSRQQHHRMAPSPSVASVRLVKARSMDKLSLIGPEPMYPAESRVIKLRPTGNQPLLRRPLLDYHHQAACCYLVPVCRKPRGGAAAAAGSHYLSATSGRRSVAGPACCGGGQDHLAAAQTTLIYTTSSSARRSCYQQQTVSCCLGGGGSPECLAAPICHQQQQQQQHLKLKKQPAAGTCCCNSSFCTGQRILSPRASAVTGAVVGKPSRDPACLISAADHNACGQPTSGCGARLRPSAANNAGGQRPYKGCAPQPPPPPPPPPAPPVEDFRQGAANGGRRAADGFRQRVSTFFAATARPTCSAAGSDLAGGRSPDAAACGSLEPKVEVVEDSECQVAAVRVLANRKLVKPPARPASPPCPPPPPTTANSPPFKVIQHQRKDSNNNNPRPTNSLLAPAPLERLCFVDELKMLAERQERAAAATSPAPGSAAPDTCPALIKIINASKQQQLAAARAKRAAPAPPPGRCSCQLSSVALVGAESRRPPTSAGHATSCPGARSTLLANQVSEPGAKCPHEVLATGAAQSTLAEEDNKRRQHELLMKEFKSAHLRMFKRRNNSGALEAAQELPRPEVEGAREPPLKEELAQPQPQPQSPSAEPAGTCIKTINTKKSATAAAAAATGCTRSSPLVVVRSHQPQPQPHYQQTAGVSH